MFYLSVTIVITIGVFFIWCGLQFFHEIYAQKVDSDSTKFKKYARVDAVAQHDKMMQERAEAMAGM